VKRLDRRRGAVAWVRECFVTVAAAVSLVACGSEGPEPVVAPPVTEQPGELVVAAGQSVAAGDAHTCALLVTGAVTCWGDNTYGQLGRGSPGAGTGASPPDALATHTVDLGAKRTAKAIAVGSNHSCAILENDQLKCWGLNSDGQLGQGDTLTRGIEGGMGDQLSPVNLGTGRTAKAVTAGDAHTCVILDTNRVKCWGRGYEGPLGYGDGIDRGSAPGTMGDHLPVVDLGTGRTAKAIAATGYRTTCAILDNNRVKCWGINQSCALGTTANVISYGYGWGTMGDNLPYVDIGVGRTALAIAAGGETVCARRDNGTVKCWGSNLSGQVGVNSTLGSWGCSASELGDNGIVSLGGTDATAVEVGRSHTCALRSNGELKCWGENGSGQLGVGNTTDLRLPSSALSLGTGFTARAVSVGGDHTCAISTGNRVKCWGRGAEGQLGNGSTANRGTSTTHMGNNLAFANLGSRPVLKLAVGWHHNCAILPSGQVKCWGFNFEGQLGVGHFTNVGWGPNEMGNNLPVLALGTSRTAKSLALGLYHTCAALDNNTLKCWGYNSTGQLGYGTTDGSTTPPSTTVNLGTGRTVHATFADPISAGPTHTCAILDNASVKCWGDNASGQLGYGDTIQRTAPASAAVNLGTGRTAKAITAGYFHTCAILDDNTVKCWGENASGQLGIGSTTDQRSPPSVVVNLGTGRTAKTIGAKGDTTCALLDNNTVKCWGENSAGQLGIGSSSDQTSPGTTVSVGTSQSIVTLSVGGEHACALLGTNQVKCWGQNLDGQLGTWQEGAVVGDVTVGERSNEMGDFLATASQGGGRTVKAVVSGGYHTCFVLDTDQVRCTGSNNAGELGVGDSDPHPPAFFPAPVVDLGTDP
jgi:alpha-tubulin suppressor-like RCC1 family protein